MDIMQKTIGSNVMTYEVDKNGFYTFSDGTTFDYSTQDLCFGPEKEPQYFEVILVSFGKQVLDTKVEEVFVHFNLSHTLEKDQYILYHEQHQLKSGLNRSVSDSIQIMEFFETLAQKAKIDISVQLDAKGVIGGTPPYYISETNPVLSKATDGNVSKLTYNALVKKQGSISIELMVGSNPVIPENMTGYEDFKIKHPGFNEIDFWTYTQCKPYFLWWKSELLQLSETWLKDHPDRKKVIKKIKKLKAGSVTLKGQKFKITSWLTWCFIS